LFPSESIAPVLLPWAKGLLAVAKTPRTHKELIEWQKEYDQVEQQWLAWYQVNKSQFRTVKAAWAAFSDQWEGKLSFLDIKSSLQGRK
jgi:hypothetical protein